MQIALLVYLLFVISAQGRDLVEYTISLGYGLQNHQVITEDGYILTLHRIPYNKREAMADWQQKPVIFLMHGMMGTSASFINQGPHSKLAFALSDAGFDVWLGNARGNPYSRAHQSLNPDHSSDHIAFFNFSWEEIAIFDLRGMVDYILGATGEKQIRFIGDTQGGTFFLILNHLKPEYNTKFLMAQLLDPVGYTNYFPSAELTAIAHMIDSLYEQGRASGLVEISSLNLQSNLTVTPYFVLQSLVSYIASLAGLSSMGTSLKQLVHYFQNIRDKSFRRWNYGETFNHRVYGTNFPPPYNLSQVTVYTILYYRKNNMFLDKRDVSAMANDMPKAKAIGINESVYYYSDLIDIARTG